MVYLSSSQVRATKTQRRVLEVAIVNNSKEHQIRKGVKNAGEAETQKDMINQAFYYMNAFKRHRVLAHQSRMDGDRDKANYNELKQYQFIESLELTLRALQKDNREHDYVVTEEEE